MEIVNSLYLKIKSKFSFTTKLVQPLLARLQQTKLYDKLASLPLGKKQWFAVAVIIATPLILLVFLLVTSWKAYSIYPDIMPFSSYQEYNQFLQDNPFYSVAPPSDQPFTFTSHIRADKRVLYTFKLFTLSARSNMTEDYKKKYLNNLKQNQQKALNWIKQQNVDPETLSIIWRPNPTDIEQVFFGGPLKPIPQKTTPTPTARPTFAQ